MDFTKVILVSFWLSTSFDMKGGEYIIVVFVLIKQNRFYDRKTLAALNFEIHQMSFIPPSLL